MACGVKMTYRLPPILLCFLFIDAFLNQSAAFQLPLLPGGCTTGRPLRIRPSIMRARRITQLHLFFDGTEVWQLQQQQQHLASIASSLQSSTYTTTMMLAAEEESWRQYVPLIVSGFVIIDILLGSPAANSVLGILRSSSDEAAKNDSDNQRQQGSPRKTTTVNTKGERIDSEQLANAALERARNALEWNTEREKYKTDYDRMEEIRRKMDDQLRKMDEEKP